MKLVRSHPREDVATAEGRASAVTQWPAGRRGDGHASVNELEDEEQCEQDD